MSIVNDNFLLYGQGMMDFFGVCDNWTRLNLKYMSIYVNTFLKTAREFYKLENVNDFYGSWLSNMDSELEDDLRSKKFINILKEYMNSAIALRSDFRRAEFPVEFYDILFYSTKKLFMNFHQLIFVQNTISSTPSEVVFSVGKITLRLYTDSRNGTNPQKPLLLVYAQINRFNILDISSDRSVVRNLMSMGFDVYVLDWGYSGKRDDDRSLEDHVNIIRTVVDLINSRSSHSKLPIVGYCWGGLLSLIFTALYKESVQSLVLLASPVDSSKDTSLMAEWARAVDADKMIDEFGHMDGQILDLVFMMRNPPRNLFDKYLKMTKYYNDRHLVDSFAAVEKWLYNTPPIPGALYRQIINDFYKKNLLLSNAININGKKVTLNNIDIPVLAVVAEKDDLVSPASTLAIFEYIASRDKDSFQIPGGHVGLCISKLAHEKLWPEIAEWISSMIVNDVQDHPAGSIYDLTIEKKPRK